MDEITNLLNKIENSQKDILKNEVRFHDRIGRFASDSREEEKVPNHQAQGSSNMPYESSQVKSSIYQIQSRNIHESDQQINSQQPKDRRVPILGSNLQIIRQRNQPQDSIEMISK